MVLVAPDHIASGSGRLLEYKTASEQNAISGKYLFEPGDIVYSKIRPYLRKAILAEFRGLCSADMYPLSPVKDVSSAFILAILLGHHFSTFAINASARSGIPKINRLELSQYTIALPPPQEQRAIADVLRDMDKLLGAMEKLLAKKRDIKQAAMQQLLTGQNRLPGFHGKWEVKKIGELLKYERPNNYFVKSDDYQDNAKTPVLTANKSFILGYTNENFGIYDALPVIIFDDFTTDSKYVDFPFKVKSSAIKILKSRSAETKLKFVYERMRLVDFPLGEHKRYYISEYQHVGIPTPKPTEQTAIAEVLSDMDMELAALTQRRDKTRDLKQGMMQELLTGRIRLV